MIILFASLKRAHANPRRIDRLYRSRLSRYKMEPVDIDKCPVVRSNNHSPLRMHLRDTDAHHIATTLATHKTAILLVAAACVAGITGGIIGFQIGKNTASGTNSGNGPMVETRCTASPDSTELTKPVVETQCIASLQTTTDDHPVIVTNNHSPQRTKNVPTHIGNMPSPVETLHATSLQNPDTSPVIITTKIPVHQTVVIRDTTTISDTVFFNYE